MVNEGLGWDPLLKMVHNPGGHCYCEGATPKIYSIIHIYIYMPDLQRLALPNPYQWLAG